VAELTKTITREGRELVVRTDPNGKKVIKSFHLRLYKKLGEATTVQIRVLAEESREMVLDRLNAARPQPPGQLFVERPPRKRRPNIATSERRPYRHAPLAPDTVARKDKNEQDGRKLIATGVYTHGIEVFKGTERGVIYYIVRPKPGKHPEAGVTHRVLAAFHEFGTSTIPKRPHWGPVLTVVRNILKKRRKSIRAEALRKALRRSGG
jgi:hypothetical protein